LILVLKPVTEIFVADS